MMWIDRAHILCIWTSCLGMMMAVVHNRLNCMYIHYELCILRFYEACFGLVGFCLLGLSASHGRRIWVVTNIIIEQQTSFKQSINEFVREYKQIN